MEKIRFVAKYEGNYADDHTIPAYDGLVGLAGLARSILVPTHYLLEGKVRHRSINSSKYQLLLSPPRVGSFEGILDLAFVSGAVLATNPVASGILANYITSAVTSAVKMTVGLKRTRQERSRLEEAGVGNGALAAIAAAIEPGLKQSHRVINNGVININYIAGNEAPVTLDQSTKHYINTDIKDDTPRVGLLSVSVYNSNDRSGGAFMPEAERVVSFKAPKNIDRKSVKTILDSQRDYTMGLFDPDEDSSYVAFKYLQVLDIDDRIKRIEVIKVRPTMDEL